MLRTRMMGKVPEMLHVRMMASGEEVGLRGFNTISVRKKPGLFSFLLCYDVGALIITKTILGGSLFAHYSILCAETLFKP